MLAAVFWFTLETLLHFNIGHRAAGQGASDAPLWDATSWDLPDAAASMKIIASVVACAALSQISLVPFGKRVPSAVKALSLSFWFGMEAMVHYQIGRQAPSTLLAVADARKWLNPTLREWSQIIISVIVTSLLSEATAHFLRSTRLAGADVAEITNTVNRIMMAMDAGDGDAFAASFTEDGVCEIAINGARAEGRDALRKLGIGIHAKFAHCRHWEGNVTVRRSAAGELTNISYWKALDGGEVVSTGTHYDTLVQERVSTGAKGGLLAMLGVKGGHFEWLIKSRRIVHTWTKAAGRVEATAA